MYQADPIDAEIEKANALARSMIEAYVAWGDKIQTGNIHYAMYFDMLDYVNFRIETADSCLDLIGKRRIADALGLCRSLMENYLLLMLMCRGDKYFILRDLTSKTEGEFKAFLTEEKRKLAEKHGSGEGVTCIEIASYRRAKRHIMYVYKGLFGSEEPDITIPLHYFQFQNFDPEAMRLGADDYFTYFETPELEEQKKQYQAQEAFRYKHYLSYDALIQCLQLNDLVDSAAQTRIDAHYTFLGKYLHPTHRAARELHEQSNIHDGRTSIGMNQRYEKQAFLLASLYLCYCLAGILDEAASLIENAPEKYITDAGTGPLRDLISRVAKEFPYFWFLFNEAPFYDRFNYAVHHVSDADLATFGGYAGVPSERVPFNKDIYENFKHALQGWSNSRCGTYPSPLTGR